MVGFGTVTDLELAFEVIIVRLADVGISLDDMSFIFWRYPYPSTPVHPPPFSTTPRPIYQNPYHTYYMTPAALPMSYYPVVPIHILQLH